MKNVLFIIMSILLLQACVPAKKFQEKEALANKYLADKRDCNEKLTKANDDLEAANDEIDRLKSQVKILEADTAQMGLLNRQLQKTINDLQEENGSLSQAQKDLLASSSAKQAALMQQLTDKESELAALAKQLATKEQELNQLAASLEDRETKMNELEGSLQEKLARINELESALSAKDSAMLSLKTKIMDALKGFSSDELTVQEKEGKVYISLSEKLLFKSGSFTVEKNGEDALVKVADVLKKQEDVDIVVEGHADSDKFSGSAQLKDNWDLSVKRATSVVRILVEENELSAENVSASGRSYYKPIADNETDEGKSKNRRTEIILSPKLEAIFNLLESE